MCFCLFLDDTASLGCHIFHCGLVSASMCVQWWSGLWQPWAKDEDEWDAGDKGVVVYLGNGCLSLESAYLFSRVFEFVCFNALECAPKLILINLQIHVCKKLNVFLTAG